MNSKLEISMSIIQFESLENKLIQYNEQLVIIDSDVAELYGVETRDVNKAVKNNPDKFPSGYVIELTKDELETLRWKFSTAKFNMTRVLPKVFTEKGLYMLATIIKSAVATQTTLSIIETFAKVKELSRNINSIMKTEDEEKQKELASKSNKILEDIIEIEPDILSDDEDGEVVETTTKFEFNLGFAKISRSIKKIKK
jgi:phage regulator Rha-like protein